MQNEILALAHKVQNFKCYNVLCLFFWSPGSVFCTLELLLVFTIYPQVQENYVATV